MASESRIKTVKVDLSSEDMARIGALFVRVFNEAQRDLGFTIEEVIQTALVTMGGVMYQAGVVVDFDRPVREALPQILDGYDMTERNLRQGHGSETDAFH